MKENLISESVLCSLIKTQVVSLSIWEVPEQSDNKSCKKQLLHRNCLRWHIEAVQLYYTAAHGEILHYSFFAMLLLVGYAVYPQKEMEEVELEGEF